MDITHETVVRINGTKEELPFDPTASKGLDIAVAPGWEMKVTKDEGSDTYTFTFSKRRT